VTLAWLLKRSYAAIKSAEPGTSSTVLSGGLFGHDPGGAAQVMTEPNGATQRVVKKGTSTADVGPGPSGASTTCTSSVPSGADYLCNSYVMGQKKAGWRAGAYPLDGVGQH
jgi:hypothetical protein